MHTHTHTHTHTLTHTHTYTYTYTHTTPQHTNNTHNTHTYSLTHTHIHTITLAAGTAKALSENGVPCEVVYKIHEGRPNPTDMMRNGDIKMIFMTNSSDDLDRTDGEHDDVMHMCSCMPICSRRIGVCAC